MYQMDIIQLPLFIYHVKELIVPVLTKQNLSKSPSRELKKNHHVNIHFSVLSPTLIWFKSELKAVANRSCHGYPRTVKWDRRKRKETTGSKIKNATGRFLV